MISRVVTDASPLIVLIKSDLAHILPKIFASVMVPGSVYDEILAGRSDDKARLSLPGITWAHRVDQIKIVDAVGKHDLGHGEAETLSYALASPGVIALIDDAAARNRARSLGIPYLGTGGLLVIAKRQGHIRSLNDALAAVKDSGLWISQEVVELLLTKAGE